VRYRGPAVKVSFYSLPKCQSSRLTDQLIVIIKNTKKQHAHETTKSELTTSIKSVKVSKPSKCQKSAKSLLINSSVPSKQTNKQHRVKHNTIEFEVSKDDFFDDTRSKKKSRCTT
jgi:hypothetical protein